MTEQASEKKTGGNSKALVKVLIGVVLIIIGLLAVIGWWKDLVVLFKGGIGLILIMAGAIAIAIAKE